MTCKKILVFAGMLALCLAGLSGCKDKKRGNRGGAHGCCHGNTRKDTCAIAYRRL